MGAMTELNDLPVWMLSQSFHAGAALAVLALITAGAIFYGACALVWWLITRRWKQPETTQHKD